MLADIFRGQSSGKILRGWKVLHAAMCWRTQNNDSKAINSKTVLPQRRWDKLTKRVGGLSKIEIPPTLCTQTSKIVILTLIKI